MTTPKTRFCPLRGTISKLDSGLRRNDGLFGFVRIGQICAGQRAITPDTALRLAVFFGTDAQSWVNLQAHYDNEQARVAMEDVLAKIHQYQPMAA